MGYVFLHSMLFLLQATTLNVAINASNKALLTIMMSNNFVELKGSVFKKFDKNNLFQVRRELTDIYPLTNSDTLEVSCSDVRERFHLFALLFVVVVQTMKEYGWREESFWDLAPDCLLVLGAEIMVDWVKHAFITRFNDLPADVYNYYTISLAYDLAQTKQKYAFSDHSDIVSRRMGFIPLPLGVVMLRVVYTSVRSTNPGAWAVVVMAYFCLLTFRILGSIVILGKACDLIDEHRTRQETERKEQQAGAPSKTTSSSTVFSRTTEPAVSPPADQFEDHQRIFLYQSGSEDRGDVLLTNMNSALEDLGLAREVDSPEKEVEDDQEEEEEEEETPRLASPVTAVESLNGSLLGPAVESLEKEREKEREREKEEVERVLVRSHSSPDLVTEGSGSD